MRIKVLSKSLFDSQLQRMKINDENVETHPYAFISIQNSDQPNGSYFKRDHTNVLRLVFDDATDVENQRRSKLGLAELQLFTKEQAKQIIDFMEKHKEVETFYVHCLAGQSRSGAVGTFINDTYGSQNFYQFCQSNPIIKPNYFILALLRRVYNNIEED